MRVIHFVSDIGISNGVMSFILNSAKAICNKVKFDIAYFSEVEINQQNLIHELGGTAYLIPAPGPNKRFFKAVNDILSKNNYSAVHIHLPYLTALIAPIARKNKITNIIAHGHTAVFSLNPKNTLRNKIMNFPTKYLATTCLAPSKQTGKLWFGRKYRILNNAVDCSKYRFDSQKRDEIRKQYGLENKFVVSHIGQTTVPLKNHPFLVKVFYELLKEKPDSALMLIGGIETPDMRALTDELKITDKIVYLGMQEKVWEFLMASDAFVFPSVSEGLGIAIVEAQASGLFCLISDSIPNEACVTENVKKVSLTCSPKIWADLILDIKESDRKNVCDAVENSGWDVKHNADILIKLYKGEK